MESTIRILLLEDVESDALLAEHEIKKIISNYTLKWVDNREDYILALNNFDPSIIISDYNLPTFDGLSALKLRNASKPHVPFILFTGSLNEDTAVECMKAGATDYIIKEHTKRLGAALISALEQSKLLKSKLKSEIELIQSEERFRRLAENGSDIIYRYVLKPKKGFEYINPVVKSITGYTPEEHYNDPELWNKITHPDDRTLNKTLEITSDHFYKPIIQRWFNNSGKIIWVEQRNIPIFGEYGEIIAIEGIVRDITSRKQSEVLQKAVYDISQAASETNNLNDLYVKIHNIIKVVMPAENFFIANYDKNTDTIRFSYYADEVDVKPADRKSGHGLTEYVIRTGKPLLCTKKLALQLISSGEVEQIGISHAIWLGVPLKTDGIPIGVMVVQHYHDKKTYGIGELEVLEYVSIQVAKAIERIQNEIEIIKLTKAVEQSPLSIVITDLEGNIEYSNPMFTQLTGYTAAEVKGKNSRILNSGQTPKNIYPELWETLKSGNTWFGEFKNRKKNGDIFIEKAQISPIFSDDKKPIHYLAITDDITEQKKAEKELIDAKEKALESDKLKTAFLQNISHEIRTPMNAIIGFSELMQLELDEPEKLKYYTSLIFQRSNDLLGIINELLDIAKIESGQLKVSKDLCELNKIIEELDMLFSKFNSQTEKSNIKLTSIKIPSNSASNIYTDAEKLKQVFTNLLNNAYKFTEEGKIEFGYYSIEKNNITFFVSDSGKGISENLKNIVFDRFRKSEDESIYAKDGLGLGLSIVKGLINLLNGKIWIESKPNKGSTFFFSIPYLPHIIQEIPQLQTARLEYKWSDYTLLIVEDDSFNATLFVEFLQPTGITLLLGTTGAQAISIFNETPNVDLVLMDIMLPDINGYDVTKEFKRIRPNIPIIAQTALAYEADKEKAFDAGCIDFISKPINRINLLEMINKYLNHSQTNT